MLIFFGCLLIVMSILVVPNLFASKKEEITGFLKKLLLYQGLIGLIGCITGLIGLIQYFLKIAADIKPILWLTGILCCAMLVILGFFLCYNLIYTLFLTKGKKAEDNLEKMRTNTMPMQGKIAIIGFLLGIWSVMAVGMFTVSGVSN
jgi:hypothetical protein